MNDNYFEVGHRFGGEPSDNKNRDLISTKRKPSLKKHNILTVEKSCGKNCRKIIYAELKSQTYIHVAAGHKKNFTTRLSRSNKVEKKECSARFGECFVCVFRVKNE